MLNLFTYTHNSRLVVWKQVLTSQGTEADAVARTVLGTRGLASLQEKVFTVLTQSLRRPYAVLTLLKPHVLPVCAQSCSSLTSPILHEELMYRNEPIKTSLLTLPSRPPDRCWSCRCGPSQRISPPKMCLHSLQLRYGDNADFNKATRSWSLKVTPWTNGLLSLWYISFDPYCAQGRYYLTWAQRHSWHTFLLK